MPRSLVPHLVALLSCATLAVPAHAAWPRDPATNVLVSSLTQAGTYNPDAIADGEGGAFVAWQGLVGNYKVFVQRVTAWGGVAAGWPAGGLQAATGSTQQFVKIVSDGAGGVYVAWREDSPDFGNIYVQRLTGAGAIAAGWPAAGVAVCTATGVQDAPRVVTDGAGGVFVAWEDARSGTKDIYLSRVTSTGALAAGWPANGLGVCTVASAQSGLQIASDGAGGAYLVWTDLRSVDQDIFVQRVLPSSAVASGWPVNGLAACSVAGQQSNPAIVPDGSGGAIVTWVDLRAGASQDLYGTRITASAAIASPFAAGGNVLVATANCARQGLSASSDGAGGVLMTWFEQRSPCTAQQTFAARFTGSGAAASGWPALGLAVGTAAQAQNPPRIAGDGAGGALVTWEHSPENDGTTRNAYVAKVTAAGALASGWSTPIAASSASGVQFNPAIAVDGEGGAIVAWSDSRTSGRIDLYAQKVDRFGLLGADPVLVSARDVPADQGGQVKLSWNASWLDLYPTFSIASYALYRSVPAQAAMRAIAAGAHTSGRGDPGSLLVRPASGQATYWEWVSSVTASHLANVSAIVPTLQDSVAPGAPRTLFMVQARDASGTQWWWSNPDSAYSVDNLPPAAPAPFAGTYAGGAAALHWRASLEPDVAGYRLYRGAAAGFTPAPANRIATPVDTAWVDPAGQTYWYKLTAVDVHGNESAATTLLPAGALDAPAAALALSFAAPRPNPAGGAVTLRFTLARTGAVTLAVLDATGRRVRTLANGALSAGSQALTWDRRDDAGRRLASGLYFVHLETEGRVLVRRVTLL